MKKYVEITGAGVGSLAAARLLQGLGYDINIKGPVDIGSDYQLFFRGTLLGGIHLTNNPRVIKSTLEAIEPGAQRKLEQYHKSTSTRARTSTIYKHASSHFNSPELQKIMQLPFVLLGLNPRTVPASKFATYQYSHLTEIDPADSKSLFVQANLSKTYPHLGSHNILLSKNWETMLSSAHKSTKWPADPTLYVGSKYDKHGLQQLTIHMPVSRSTSYTDEELNQYANWLYEIIENALHLNNLRDYITSSNIAGPSKGQSTPSGTRGMPLRR